jgi:hypothetical protein
MATASAEFVANVISVHLWLNKKEITLTQNGKKWTGKLNLGANALKTARLRIIAPINTEWSLVVKVDDKKVLDKDGTMEAQQFDHTWPDSPGVLA